jgi:hypothetical protein
MRRDSLDLSYLLRLPRPREYCHPHVALEADDPDDITRVLELVAEFDGQVCSSYYSS